MHARNSQEVRACVNAQCLECCGWERAEVAICMDMGGPLVSVRPYSVSGSGQEGQFASAEGPNRERAD